MSGVECDVYEMLNIASAKCENVVGMKYTGWDFEKYPDVFFKKYNVLVGADNILDKAFKKGCDGCIGITFNFTGDLAYNIYKGTKDNDANKVEENQIPLR